MLVFIHLIPAGTAMSMRTGDMIVRVVYISGAEICTLFPVLTGNLNCRYTAYLHQNPQRIDFMETAVQEKIRFGKGKQALQ